MNRTPHVDIYLLFNACGSVKAMFLWILWDSFKPNVIQLNKDWELFMLTCWFFFLPTDEVSSPTDLQFYEISDKKIVLTWSGPAGDISGYRVTAVPVDESGAPQKEVTLPVIENSYVEVSDLEPGTLYRFNIYSIHDGEESLPLIGEQTTSECDRWQCD